MTISRADGKNHTVCEGALSAMTDDEVEAGLARLNDWQLREGQLHRTFRCRDFADSVRLVTQIAQISEHLNHHPNFCVTNKRQVSAAIWTHKMNCLTTLDFELAEAISAAYDDRSTTVMP